MPTRIALTAWGRIDTMETYDADRILKFVEANWGLDPLTDRSRDNLHNPVTNPHDPYVPLNRPAIGDLMDLFSFGDHHGK